MHYHYNVKPRYTCGSPASVDEREALRQAEAEKTAYEYIIQGVEGVKAQARAMQLGLGPVREELICPNCNHKHFEGSPENCLNCGWPLAYSVNDGKHYSPAELVIEHSNHWFVRCLITGKMFVRPFHGVKPEKTVGCKKCRREYDLADREAVR